MATDWHYLDIADFFVIAETILGADAKTLATKHAVDRADSALHAPQAGFGETDIYASLAEKAAVLCSRLARNHPLPDGNKRVAFISMIEFLDRNDHRWLPHENDPESTVELIESVAANRVEEQEFATIVASRIAPK